MYDDVISLRPIQDLCLYVIRRTLSTGTVGIPQTFMKDALEVLQADDQLIEFTRPSRIVSVSQNMNMHADNSDANL